jgi:hypothetical protein
MKSLLVATLLATALVPGVAHADPYFGYEGRCSYATLNDTTPNAALGGQSTWNGVARVYVVPVDEDGVPTGAPVAARCELVVNDVSRGIVLDAGSGTGAVAAAGPLTYTAAVTDVVYLCTVVTIGSVTDRTCAVTLPATPICPRLVCGDGGLLDVVIATVNEAAKALDPATCAALAAAAPTVDGLPSAGFLYVDPATGDTYAGGTTPADLLWDCPPYVTP